MRCRHFFSTFVVSFLGSQDNKLALAKTQAKRQQSVCKQWINIQVLFFLQGHFDPYLWTAFPFRDLLFLPTIRLLSTLHLQLHKWSPKQWSMCVLGAEILPPSRWTGIATTAVVGKRPAIATWWRTALMARCGALLPSGWEDPSCLPIFLKEIWNGSTFVKTEDTAPEIFKQSSRCCKNKCL